MLGHNTRVDESRPLRVATLEGKRIVAIRVDTYTTRPKAELTGLLRAVCTAGAVQLAPTAPGAVRARYCLPASGVPHAAYRVPWHTQPLPYGG